MWCTMCDRTIIGHSKEEAEECKTQVELLNACKQSEILDMKIKKDDK